MPNISENYGDLLDPRFQKIFYETYNQLPDKIGELYGIAPNNGRNNMTWSQVGTIGDWDEFTGTVSYGTQSQGYDTTATPIEFVKGIQIERKLKDDDQYNIMDQRPRGLATAYQRTRQKHAARILNNAFSVDNFFYINSEGVALCSNSHTTNSGASTANGFDNLGTASLTATAVFSARNQMIGYRGDQAERISVMPDELWFPPERSEEAFEIINASGKLDTANNNPNFHQGRYTPHEWNYMADANNWFMFDGSMKKQMLFWLDRVGVEFAMVEDFDKLIAKWRGYSRHGNAHTDWRFAFGANVS